MADHHQLTQKPVVPRSAVETVLKGIITAGNGLISLLSGLLATVLIVYSGYVIIDNLAIQQRAKNTSWEILQYKPVEDDEGSFSETDLAKKVSAYRAWLSIYDTNIDYPVVQGPDDLYYASHDIYGQISLTGAIYLAAMNERNFTDSYNLIYGHHMDGNIMFGSLDQFMDEDFFNGHQQGVLVTENGVFDLTLFAAVRTDAYESNIYSTRDARTVLQFLRDPSGGIGLGTENIIYRPELAGDRIIALSTCASVETNGRLVVFGTLKQRVMVTLAADGYTGVYDGEWHGVENIRCNYPADTRIEYSLDGKEYTTVTPRIRDVGRMRVLVRATTEKYGTVETEVFLTVTPRPVTLRAVSVMKEEGRPDPALEAEVSGVLAGEQIDYVLYRDAGEEPGTYRIRARFEEHAQNYRISYVPGTLTILERPANRKGIASTEEREYTLRVIYLSTDGKKMAEDTVLTLQESERYRIETPSRAGYSASQQEVTGLMPAEDLTLTVLYMPVAAGPAESALSVPGNLFVPYVPAPDRLVTDVETPLNLGRVTINVGDGVE